MMAMDSGEESFGVSQADTERAENETKVAAYLVNRPGRGANIRPMMASGRVSREAHDALYASEHSIGEILEAIGKLLVGGMTVDQIKNKLGLKETEKPKVASAFHVKGIGMGGRSKTTAERSADRVLIRSRTYDLIEDQAAGPDVCGTCEHAANLHGVGCKMCAAMMNPGPCSAA